MSQSSIQALLPMVSPAESRVLPSRVLPQLEASLLKSSRSLDSPGIPCCPLIAWFRGTPKPVVLPQRHNAAQLHPTSNGWNYLPGQAEQDKLYHHFYASSSSHLPRRLPLHILAPHSFLQAKADLGPDVWWLLFLPSLPLREEKVCSEPL